MMIVEDRDFIRKAFNDHNLHLADFHEAFEVLSVKEFSDLNLKRRAGVLLLDTKSLLSKPELLEKCNLLFNTFSGVMLFHDQDDEVAIKWITGASDHFPKIIGKVSLPLAKFEATLLSNQLAFFWSNLLEQKQLQKHMSEFSQELNQVLQTAEWEMTKAKKIYEVLVPKRSQEIKGVHFYNKYATGGGGGAEFYDVHQEGHRVFQILVASESYLISSSLLGLLNTHKKKEFNPTLFMKDALADIDVINGSKKKKSDVGILLIEMDMNNLQLKTYGKHKAEFCSQLKGRVTLEPDQIYPLSKDEKFIVFSPGFLFNWKESKNKSDVYSFIKSHRDEKIGEIMTELFYQIRESVDEDETEKRSQFLKRDATVVIMEINRHAIHSL